MNIHSIVFFAFAAVVLAVYYLCPRRMQNFVLLVASYLFYISISWDFALILVAMTLANFFLGKQVGRGDRTKHWLSIGIGINLLVLVFFKLASFYVSGAMDLISLLGLDLQTRGLKILLPIGLSFYVLQAISYLVDVYRKQMNPSSKLVEFALYLAYFPKLTAGPIERARNFLPKLSGMRSVDKEQVSRSFALIIIGLFRKVVVADTLFRAIPNQLFKTPSEYSSLELLAWIIAFSLALYNDFCGYTNIVRGVSGFFGIELSKNFQNPVFSRTFSELWIRWHMSLSFWLRDYIFFPISRALVRRNPSRTNILNIIVPPVVTMLASGLWHGPNLSYLTWGLLMGLFLVGERLFTLWKPLVSPDKKPLWKQLLNMTFVMSLSMGAFVVFLLNYSTAAQFFQSLVTNVRWVLPSSRVFLVIPFALWIDFVQYRNKDELVFLKWPQLSRSFVLALAILGIFLYSQSRLGTPFVYQGF
ncbi:MAG: MBOAT family protein [Candidatus Aminicenantes bacterium]|nr:MBOAT family protein [Candidatus Aminicenantes bacterium]